MKWVVLSLLLLSLAACSAPAERRVADSPFVQSDEADFTEGQDRSFSYLSDEITDHFDECDRGWSIVFGAFDRRMARDWERVEKTFR